MKTEGLVLVIMKGIRGMFVVWSISGRHIVRRIATRLMMTVLRRTISKGLRVQRGV